jgi:uncharacterized protein YbjT (DUF2867 family)
VAAAAVTAAAASAQVVVVAMAAAVAVVAPAAVVMAAAASTAVATKPARTALLAGATGLVGRELLQLLLADARYSAVHCLGRRAPTLRHAKLVAHTVDFANAKQLSSVPACDDVYIALGTTIKVAGSQAAFKAVDHDAVVAIAQSNLHNQTDADAPHDLRIGMVSAMGADAQSGVFYNRTKGQTEAAISALGYASVSIARPSMLAGDRDALQQASRPAEQIGLVLMRSARFLIPANYQAIEAADVARALHRMVTHTGSLSGTRVALSGELQQLARG